MIVRTLVSIVVLALASFAGPAPSSAQSPSELALMLPLVVTAEGQSIVGDLQFSGALSGDCARTRRSRQRCEELRSLAGQPAALVMAELFQSGWDLRDTFPVKWVDVSASAEAWPTKWTGPALEADLDCEISMGEDASRRIVLGASDGEDSSTGSSTFERTTDEAGSILAYAELTADDLGTTSGGGETDLAASELSWTEAARSTCSDVVQTGLDEGRDLDDLSALWEAGSLAVEGEAVEDLHTGFLYVYSNADWTPHRRR